MLRSDSRRCAHLLLTIACASAAASVHAELHLMSSSPAHGQAGVATTAPIVLSFSAALFPASVLVNSYPSCISLEPSTGRGGAVITFQASLSADRKTLTLAHSVPFDDARTYVLTLTTPPASPCLRQDDLAKTPLSPGPVPHAILFTTADDTPPSITSHTPADGGDLPPGTPITVTFTEPLAPESLRVQTEPPVSVSVQLSDGGRTLSLLPAHSDAETICSFLILAEDVSGNPLQPSDASVPGSQNPWTVRLLPLGPDRTPPRLLAQTPIQDTTQVDPTAMAVLRFSEAVQPTDPLFPYGNRPISVVPIGSGGVWSANLSADGTTLTLAHSEPLVPNTSHILSIPASSLADSAGNTLADDLHIAFRTAEVTPPCIAASVPADGSAEVPGDAPIVILFSEPIHPPSLRVELRKAGGSAVPITTGFSDDCMTATVSHAPLTEDGSGYELAVLSAKDLSGADLVPGALPDNVLRFHTRDLVGPTLLSTQPSNGALVPPDTAQIVLKFSEPMLSASPVIIRLAYLSGEPGPRPSADWAHQSDADVWQCTGRWSNDARTLTIDLETGPDGTPLRAGGVVTAELIRAQDAFNNPLRSSETPTLWSFRISDAGPPVLLELSPSPGALVGMACPVVIRTSKPLSSDTLRFEADGDWSQSAALISGRTWKASRRAFSSDGKTVTLAHAPFADSPPGQQASHTFRIVSATDPEFRSLISAPGLSFETTFFTGSRPWVEKLQFQWPRNTGLTPDGLLPLGCETEWRDLSTDPSCVVPRNTPFRVAFSQQMDPASVPPLISDPPLGVWDVRWEPGCMAVTMTPSQSLPQTDQHWIRSQNGEILPPPPALTLFLNYGLDAKGDPLHPYSVQLRPADAAPPQVTVDYLRNPLPDGSIPPLPDWSPLVDGTVNVPVNTTLRVRSSETLAPDGVAVANNGIWGQDITLALPVALERMDSEQAVGSQVLVRFGAPLAGGVLVGDPPSQQPAVYSITVTAEDASPLRNTARIHAVFCTKDALPPRLASVANVRNDNPRAGLLLTFTEPVAPNSLAVADLEQDGRSLPELRIDPTDRPDVFRLAYSPPPNPPGTDISYSVQILPGVSDVAGNVQLDVHKLNDPRGQSDRIAIVIPYVPGDIDGDGRFSTADVLLLFRFFVGIGTPTPGQLRAAGSSGACPSASDVSRLLRKLVSG